MALANGLVLLIGAGLISVPIVLHFLMQPKLRALTFPAMRFVIPLEKTNKRRLRLKHLLLLLLRCLLIIALAAALAQPSVISKLYGQWLALGGIGLTGGLVVILLIAATFFMVPRNALLLSLLMVLLVLHLTAGGVLLAQILRGSDQPILGDRSAPVAAVILMDTSPRMAYRSENQRLFDRGREMAHWLIQQFPLDSKVCIAVAENAEPFFSFDVNASQKRLDTLEPSYGRSSIPDAIASALELLESSPLERKELYVVSDLTAESWQSSQAGLASRLAAASNVSLYVIDVGITAPQNLRLTDLQLASSAITPKDSLEVQTTLINVGPAAKRTVDLTVESPQAGRPVRQDGKTLLSQLTQKRSESVELDADGSAVIRFQMGEFQPGIHHGWIDIEGDDPLAIDNRRYFTFEVRPGWKTLVVHPQSVSPDNLVVALDVTGEFDMTDLPQERLGTTEFDDYRLIVFLNPDPIVEGTWSQLRKFAEEGGSVAFFFGHHAASAGAAAAEFLSPAALSVLPGKLTDIWYQADGQNYLNPNDMSHPIWANFRSRATSVRWNTLPVYCHWGVEPPPNEFGDAISVVGRYSNLRPALLERRIGEGRVLMMTTPITETPRPDDHFTSWNALFYGDELWAGFLLTVQSMRYLVQVSSRQLNFDINQVAVVQTPRTRTTDFWLFAPRDEEPVKLVADRNVIRYRFTDVPGNYRLRSLTDVDERIGFSVNLSDQATLLERIDRSTLATILGEGRFQFAQNRQEISRAQGVARVGQEAYPILAVIVAILLGLEFLVSTLFYRPQSATTDKSAVPRGLARNDRPEAVGTG